MPEARISYLIKHRINIVFLLFNFSSQCFIIKLNFEINISKISIIILFIFKVKISINYQICASDIKKIIYRSKSLYN